jgi:hypothetical protein
LLLNRPSESNLVHGFETASDQALPEMQRWFDEIVTKPVDDFVSRAEQSWQSAFKAGAVASGDDIFPAIHAITGAVSVNVGDVGDRGLEDERRDPEEDFVRWCFAWLLVKPTPTFHTIRMHAAFSAADLRRELRPVLESAKRASDCLQAPAAASAVIEGSFGPRIAKLCERYRSRHPIASSFHPSFVVFLDEVNTSSILGAVQDVMLDNSLDGEALPSNIFWVCATNPCNWEGTTPAADRVDEASGRESYRSGYQVRPLPYSMRLVKWQFGEMSNDAEEAYISAKVQALREDGGVVSQPHPSGVLQSGGNLKLLTLPDSDRMNRMFDDVVDTGRHCSDDSGKLHWFTEPIVMDDVQSKLMTDLISTAHRFIRVKIGSSAVSQRDLQRVFRALPFFWNHLIRRKSVEHLFLR